MSISIDSQTQIIYMYQKLRLKLLRSSELEQRPMKSRGSTSQADVKSGEEVAADQLEGGARGDIIWVKSQDNSWWPAQVVDENAVSGRHKPENRLEGQVLVRLYGSYKYLYVDPVSWRSEFDEVLKQNNGSCREIFQKALEQDLQLKSDKSKVQGLKSDKSKVQGSKSKAGASKSKGKKPIENKAKPSVEVGDQSNVRITRAMKAKMEGKSASKDVDDESSVKTEKQKSAVGKGKGQGGSKRGSSETKEETPSTNEQSSRKMRVMQNLGLAPPTGSPFQKKRQT